MFGQGLLDEAVQLTEGFVFHLGDACDISNTGEFAHFALDMRNVETSGGMAPGNHRRRAYRLSQAVWASRAELSTRGPRSAPIDPDISLLVLPARMGERALQ
jgi:hypothetical protein